jgi:solute carrier family 50 (sugar transporter)
MALHGHVRLFAVGVLCSALTIGMYAAPMAAMVSTSISIHFCDK